MSHSHPVAAPEPPQHTDPLFPDQRPLLRVGRALVSGASLLAASLTAWLALPVLVVFAGFFPCISDACPPRNATAEATLFASLLGADIVLFLLIASLSVVAIVRNNLRGFAIGALVLTWLPALYALPALVMLAGH